VTRTLSIAAPAPSYALALRSPHQQPTRVLLPGLRPVRPHCGGDRWRKAPSVLAASPSYVAKNRTPADSRALTEQQCTVMAKNSGRANWRLEGPSGSIEVTVSGRFRANSAGAVMQAAVAGLFHTIIPSLFVCAARLPFSESRMHIADPAELECVALCDTIRISLY
jgi:DNA-binding transcriptional LysR family regulator